jgi:RNA polymerase sigma-70 factor (ECF subfamily)
MTEPGEADLVHAAQAGSPDAFAALVARHQRAVRGFLRRLCGDHADADDLAQEAFVTAWSRIGAFRPGESLRAWLCGIAYRKWMTQRRSEARRLAREAATGGDPVCSPHAAGEASMDARAALAHLPPDQRAAVALCLAADFSHAEASEALGMPLGTVKSHVARGRAKLLEVLGAADERS